MGSVKSALVIGGGLGGMSAAISLRLQGVDVHLIDVDPHWRALGAGLTITGPTLRAFDRLGVLDGVREKGYLSAKVRFFSCDGTFVREMVTPALEPGLPQAGGILRPDLHAIFSSRVRDLGTKVSLGIRVSTLSPTNEGVDAAFSDGTSGKYDLAVGADGFHSATRQLLFPEASKARFTGEGCWRMLADRPAEVTGPEIYFGPNYKVGVNPCSPAKMYLFANVAMEENVFIPDDELLERMDHILAPIGGTIQKVRSSLGPHSEVIYRPLEVLMMPLPWHKGRIGLIGDAVHATTPHLASGAGLAVEDGLLLGELMGGAESVEERWEAFGQRRFPRCKTTVDNSVQILNLELEGGHDAEIAQIMGQSVQELSKPI